MVLPLPGGGSKGGGGCEGQDIGPPETEYGRAIYCGATDSGVLRGGRETAADTSSTAVVGTVGNLLEAGEGRRQWQRCRQERTRQHWRLRD